MKIAIIGSGGREHAIAWKLQQSKNAEKVFVLPGNGGTGNNISIDVNDFAGIKSFCEKEKIDLVFVGPELPLANGIVDYFADSEIMVFGPDKKASQLESSKIFAKKFMKKYGVATGVYYEFGENLHILHKRSAADGDASFDSAQDDTNFAQDDKHFVQDDINFAQEENKIREIITEMNGNCVIKYDGLAAGKGVFVCSSVEEAENSVSEIKEKYGNNASFLIEERLSGSELSILAFTDGENYQIMLPSQDHKQLLDGDKGPNTGGMGAFCPVPFFDENLRQQIEERIIKPTIIGLKKEDFNYKGVIYFGLMITDKGPKVLEYNVRLGDPETEVVLPALKSDLLELVLSCFNGGLKNFQMEFNDGFFVDVVLASGGYPKSYQKGYEISGLENLSDDTLIFHAGTKKVNNKILTNGGRVLNIVSHGKTLNEAIEKVYNECEKVKFRDVYYRTDIGKRDFFTAKSQRTQRRDDL